MAFPPTPVLLWEGDLLRVASLRRLAHHAPALYRQIPVPAPLQPTADKRQRRMNDCMEHPTADTPVK